MWPFKFVSADERRKERGFTLIELLVVIAIIGMLSSVILASLNSARKKGRDSRRLQDLRQIANSVAIVDTGGAAIAFSGCGAAGSRVSLCTGNPTGPDLTAYKDPSGVTSACLSQTPSATCDYTVYRGAWGTSNPDTQIWTVCAYLETAAGPLAAPGAVYIDGNGTVRAGPCP